MARPWSRSSRNWPTTFRPPTWWRFVRSSRASIVGLRNLVIASAVAEVDVRPAAATRSKKNTLASPARPDLNPSLAELPGDIPANPYADLPPPEPRNFRSARRGSRPRTCASDASCRAAIATRAPSRPTSATRSKPGGARAFATTSTRAGGGTSTGWARIWR